MLLRRIVRAVHRWLSFSLSVLLVTIALSGGILVFAHPIDRWLNPQLFERSDGQSIGFNAAREAVLREHPQAKVSMLWSPRRHGVYEAVLHGERGLTVYVDPATGRILGARPVRESLVGWLTSLHVSLLGGHTGETVVGCIGVALMLVLSTGTFLWWPRWRRIRLGFRLRLRKNRFTAVYDLHKLTGMTTLPLMLLISLTGFFLTFNTVGRVVVHALTLSQPLEYPTGEALHCPPTGDAQRLQPEQLQRIAENAVRGSETMYLAFPEQDDPAVQIRLLTAGSRHPYGFARVWLHPYNGSVLHHHDPAELNLGNRFYAEWMFPLHIGSYAGTPSKLLHAAVSVVPSFLMLTGWFIWRKRRSKLHAAHNEPATLNL